MWVVILLFSFKNYRSNERIVCRILWEITTIFPWGLGHWNQCIFIVTEINNDTPTLITEYNNKTDLQYYFIKWIRYCKSIQIYFQFRNKNITFMNFYLKSSYSIWIISTAWSANKVANSFFVKCLLLINYFIKSIASYTVNNIILEIILCIAEKIFCRASIWWHSLFIQIFRSHIFQNN